VNLKMVCVIGNGMKYFSDLAELCENSSFVIVLLLQLYFADHIVFLGIVLQFI